MRAKSLVVMAVLLGAGVLNVGCEADTNEPAPEQTVQPSEPVDSAGQLEQFWLETYSQQAGQPTLHVDAGIGYPVLAGKPYHHGSPQETHHKCESDTYRFRLLAKAKPDECYFGICKQENLESFNSVYPGNLDRAKCLALGGQPKVNQSYPWGLTEENDRLWFGTAANVLCQAIQGLSDVFGQVGPLETDAVVCEAGCPVNNLASNAQNDFVFTDVRPVRFFVHDVRTGQLHDLTPAVLKASPELLRKTVGIRSAGNLKGVVLFGGLVGAVIGTPSIVFFAFDADTRQYLGAKEFTQYTNTRQFIVARDQLYVGVGSPTGGELLRWVGNARKFRHTRNLDDLIAFETVGSLPADPAYLAAHQGRIFASTWGSTSGVLNTGMLLLMSPPLGGDGKLTASDASGWKTVWQLEDYEVEPTAIQLGGALASFGKYLYWGTMTLPGIGADAFCQAHGCSGTADQLGAFLGTLRPISLFRGENLGTPQQKTELLYGNPYLPRYDAGKKKWEIVPNHMNQWPKYGLAGMNNLFNTYTWWMQEHENELFVGTFDWLYLAAGGLEHLGGIAIPPSLISLAERFYGADLFRFKSTKEAAKIVTSSGAGNYTSYGVRTMASGRSLYLGMTNPMNLLTDPTDDLPEGGWEIRRLVVDECK